MEVIKRMAERYDHIHELKDELYFAANSSNAEKFRTLLDKLAYKAEERGNLGHTLIFGNHCSTLRKISQRYPCNDELASKIYDAGKSSDAKQFDQLLCKMLERAEAIGGLGHNLLRKMPK